ncbi:hypothetical protein [Flagellimonas olearia]|uniref:KTSC domain-containing protein n=1 Tax=Flagellimonas olearia TaxID=552546 RepID=A0A444VI02_9FLAO|nr:hypothetical protein [Allomuricauda olearia]RYC50380.1 hypothetical protein DN53_05505 [Allomuricauda olearia]
MPVYSNKRGNSPITDYEIFDNAITIWFKGGKAYTYSYDGPAGKYHVDEMKTLAKNGIGLSAYITNNVKFDYDK